MDGVASSLTNKEDSAQSQSGLGATGSRHKRARSSESNREDESVAAYPVATDTAAEETYTPESYIQNKNGEIELADGMPYIPDG